MLRASAIFLSRCLGAAPAAAGPEAEAADLAGTRGLKDSRGRVTTPPGHRDGKDLRAGKAMGFKVHREPRVGKANRESKVLRDSRVLETTPPGLRVPKDRRVSIGGFFLVDSLNQAPLTRNIA